MHARSDDPLLNRETDAHALCDVVVLRPQEFHWTTRHWPEKGKFSESFVATLNGQGAFHGSGVRVLGAIKVKPKFNATNHLTRVMHE